MKRTDQKSAIIVSASSDIGLALSKRWLYYEWKVFGTYRTSSSATKELQEQGVYLTSCDLSKEASMSKACKELRSKCSQWDILVLAPGTVNPIGPFLSSDFSEWEKSIQVNFTAQLRVIHELLKTRKNNGVFSPLVLFFAGGGTNNATINFSAYTVSKIALIKICELLAAEIDDTRFAIIGPGWVKTKIHTQTLQAGEKAGNSYQQTLKKYENEDWTPMQKVLDCCDWAVLASKEVISGRNFSVVYDAWNTNELENALLADPNMYKLRRSGNNWTIPSILEEKKR